MPTQEFAFKSWPLLTLTETAKTIKITNSRNILPWPALLCSICGDRYAYMVDHDHQTGMIRGLLCASCNSQLASAARHRPDTYNWNSWLNGGDYMSAINQQVFYYQYRSASTVQKQTQPGYAVFQRRKTINEPLTSSYINTCSFCTQLDVKHMVNPSYFKYPIEYGIDSHNNQHFHSNQFTSHSLAGIKHIIRRQKGLIP